MIERLGLIGVGLIGGSLAAALREADYVGEVVGYGRSLGNLEDATRLGLIDAALPSPEAVARAADIVVIAVPVGSVGTSLAQIADAIAPNTIVTDVGSVKGSVISAARNALGSRFAHFVPGHPLAGTEQSGVAASLPDLFQHRRVILTPEPDTDTDALARVRAMWEAAGAEVTALTAADHDRLLAVSRHLPHMLAYCLMDMVVRHDDYRAILENSAGGFSDTTRIAASDPVMWRDICLANRDALVVALRQYHVDLGALIKAVEKGDGQWLCDTFTRAKHARAKLDRIK